MSSQQSHQQPEITIVAKFRRSHDDAKPTHKEHRGLALKDLSVDESAPDIFASLGTPTNSIDS
jgi:hypothetical protein